MTTQTSTMATTPAGTSPRTRSRAAPCAAYAAGVWAPLFAAVQLYWALGGSLFYEEFTLPPNIDRALDRESL